MEKKNLQEKLYPWIFVICLLHRKGKKCYSAKILGKYRRHSLVLPACSINALLAHQLNSLKNVYFIRLFNFKGGFDEENLSGR